MRTRQAILVGPQRFEIEEKEIAPGPGELLVRMEGCGLCHSESPKWRGPAQYPVVMGHEGYGVVVECGPKTLGRFSPGDRVTGLHGQSFADYYVAQELQAIKIRADLSQKVVPGEPLYCVQNVVRAARPEIGDCVAVLGCGPMGLWAIQALAYPALKALVAVDIDEDKLALASSFGATHGINPKTCDPIERMKEISDGRLADVVVEGSGSAAGVQLATDLLRWKRPRLVIMSGYWKSKVEVDLHMLANKAVELLGAHPGICLDRNDGIRRTEILINNGTFKSDSMVTHRFPLEKIQEAFESMEQRPAGYVKGIVVP